MSYIRPEDCGIAFERTDNTSPLFGPEVPWKSIHDPYSRSKLPRDVSEKLDLALQDSTLGFKAIADELNISEATVQRHAALKNVKNGKPENQLPPDLSQKIYDELEAGGKSFSAIARELSVSIRAVTDRAEKIGKTTDADHGVPFADDKYATIDAELEKQTPKTKIAALLSINRATVLRREQYIKDQNAGRTTLEIQSRLRHILKDVLASEKHPVAAKQLGISHANLNNILLGRQDIPVFGVAKSWATVFETHNSGNLSWQNHATEFRHLMICARSSLPVSKSLLGKSKTPNPIPVKKPTSPKKTRPSQKAAEPRIVQTKSAKREDYIQDVTVKYCEASIGATVRLLRQQHNHTPAELTAKFQDIDLTASLLGQVEEGNKNIHLGIFTQVVSEVCRIYGLEAWLCAQHDRYKSPAKSLHTPSQHVPTGLAA